MYIYIYIQILFKAYIVLSHAFSMISGLSLGFLIIILPQFIIYILFFVLPNFKRIVPWIAKKPPKYCKSKEDHKAIQNIQLNGPNGENTETCLWLNVMLNYAWKRYYDKIVTGFEGVIFNEICDLYHEPPGCFLEKIEMLETSIGTAPVIDNAKIVPWPNDESKVFVI